jgi:hypothetical protein
MRCYKQEVSIQSTKKRVIIANDSFLFKLTMIIVLQYVLPFF